MQQIHSNLIDLALTTEPPPKALVVAFSGGLDSCVLLHLVKTWQKNHPDIQIQAFHVNHQLQAQADDWQRHCQDVCLQWNIPLQCVKARVDTQQASLEQAARDARYDAFSNHLNRNQALLLAHHRDDQAETLLQRLARGSGPLGLGAMSPVSQRLSLLLVRPLLDCDRQQLESYARAHDLRWVEDPSNQSDRHERNFLRNQVLPLWRKNRPQLNAALARSARLCQDSAQLLDELAELDLGEPRADLGLSAQPLLGLSQVRQHNLLRYWIRYQNYSLPSEAILSKIVPEVVCAQQDAQPQMEWGQVMLRRYKGVLYLLPRWFLRQEAVDASLSKELLKGGLVELPYGQLEFSVATFPAANKTVSLGITACLDQPIRIGSGSLGERVRPIGRPGKALKQWLQEYGVPPWLRQRWPVLYCGDQVAALPGLFVCQQFAPKGDSDALTLGWKWRFGCVESQE